MKKTITMIFVFLITSSFVSAHGLSEYPEFFLEDNTPSVIIVVGDKAPASHVIAQTRIALALGTEFGQPLLGSNKLASEVKEIDNLNIISIGTACDNNVTGRILNNPEPCEKDIPKGKATIQLLESKNDMVHIILSSDSEEGIKEVAEVLANFDNYTFSSNTYEIDIVGEVVQEEEKEEQKDTLIKEKEERKEKLQENEEITGDKHKEVFEEDSKQERTIIDDSGEGPEPILKEEDSIIKIIIKWFKSLFTFWKK